MSDMSLKSEMMLVRCTAVLDCDSELLDIGIWDDLQKMKFKPFILKCEEGHKLKYKASDIMRKKDWPSQFRQQPYVDRRREFKEQQKEIH